MTEPSGPITSPLVVIPTYNEAANIHLAVHRTRTSAPAAHILVVDDGSPDGTGGIAEEIAAHDASRSCSASDDEARARCCVSRGISMGHGTGL